MCRKNKKNLRPYNPVELRLPAESLGDGNFHALPCGGVDSWNGDEPLGAEEQPDAGTYRPVKERAKGPRDL